MRSSADSRVLEADTFPHYSFKISFLHSSVLIASLFYGGPGRQPTWRPRKVSNGAPKTTHAPKRWTLLGTKEVPPKKHAPRRGIIDWERRSSLAI